jgi:hypothetical protein
MSLIREVGCCLIEPFVSMTAAFTSAWEALLIRERGDVLRDLHGDSELWLGSAMQLWRMVVWHWCMAEASGRS